MTALSSPSLTLELNDIGITNKHIRFIYWESYSSLFLFVHQWYIAKEICQSKWNPQQDLIILSLSVFPYEGRSTTAIPGLFSVVTVMQNLNFPRGVKGINCFQGSMGAYFTLSEAFSCVKICLCCVVFNFIWYQMRTIHNRINNSI